MSKYKLALSEGTLSAFLEEYCFTMTVVGGDTPAKEQGLEGEYILLEYADWNPESTTSLFDKMKELQGKPVDILIKKGDTVSRHHFENRIGAKMRVRQRE